MYVWISFSPMDEIWNGRSFPPNSKLLCRLVTSLKDYAVKAILNAVDHLGSVSCKVNSVVSEEVDEVSVAESEVSCIEQVPFGRLPFTNHALSVGTPRLTIVLPFLLQRLRTWQASIDHEGLSQQSLSLRPPKYHERYILPGKLTASICNNAVIILDIAWIGWLVILHFLLFLLWLGEFMDEGFHPPEDNDKLQQHQTGIVLIFVSYEWIYMAEKTQEHFDHFASLFSNRA